jgi:phospholipid/cholesterol/gamma-HCH transport system substrate-binding protein
VLPLLRRTAPFALVLAVVAVAAVVLWPRGDYRVAFRTVDTGQLIVGNPVVVAGVQVGRVSAVELDRDRRARIELRIDDHRWRPLPRGTRATITAGSLAGSRNRSVALISPAEGRRAGGTVPDGGLLADDDVTPLVDVDQVLSSLDPGTRRNLSSLVRRADRNLAGTGENAQTALRRTAPALTATSRLLRDVATEEPAVGRLIDAADELTDTLAAHEDDLRVGLSGARRATGAVAAERRGLGSTLDRAPRLLADATSTLKDVRPTIDRLRTTVRRGDPLVDPLVRLARGLADGAPSLTAATTGTTGLVRDAAPLLKRSGTFLPKLRTGLADGRTTFTAVRPLMDQIRPYAPDVLSGFTAGFAGASGGYYDANGAYARVSLNAGGGITEAPAGLPDIGLLPRLLGQTGYRTGLTSRCPGAGAPPGLDASNPWKPAGVVCDLAQTLGATSTPSGKARP